jgi:hypothetical protein
MGKGTGNGTDRRREKKEKKRIEELNEKKPGNRKQRVLGLAWLGFAWLL